MVELEARACRASLALVIAKRALAAIALPDFALHVGRHVSGGRAATSTTGLGRGRELLSLELRDQQVEREFEDMGQLA